MKNVKNRYNYNESEKINMKEKPQAGELTTKFFNSFKPLHFYIKKNPSVVGIFAQVFMGSWNLNLFYNSFLAKLIDIECEKLV